MALDGNMTEKPRRLGRGLEALIAAAGAPQVPVAASETAPDRKSVV